MPKGRAPRKPKGVRPWVWVVLGLAVVAGVVLYERRKKQEAAAAAKLAEESTTGMQDVPPNLLSYGASPSGSNPYTSSAGSQAGSGVTTPTTGLGGGAGYANIGPNGGVIIGATSLPPRPPGVPAPVPGKPYVP